MGGFERLGGAEGGEGAHVVIQNGEDRHDFSPRASCLSKEHNRSFQRVCAGEDQTACAFER